MSVVRRVMSLLFKVATIHCIFLSNVPVVLMSMNSGRHNVVFNSRHTETSEADLALSV